MASSGNTSSFQPQVRKSLLQLIFSGAYLLRWNDKLRPRDLLEIDKQGHKMIVATLLWDKMSRELSAEKRATLARELIASVRAKALDKCFLMVRTSFLLFTLVPAEGESRVNPVSRRFCRRSGGRGRR